MEVSSVKPLLSRYHWLTDEFCSEMFAVFHCDCLVRIGVGFDYRSFCSLPLLELVLIDRVPSPVNNQCTHFHFVRGQGEFISVYEYYHLSQLLRSRHG